MYNPYDPYNLYNTPAQQFGYYDPYQGYYQPQVQEQDKPKQENPLGKAAGTLAAKQAISSLFSSSGGASSTAATNLASSGIAQTAAQNAAWNAGADAATTAAAPEAASSLSYFPQALAAAYSIHRGSKMYERLKRPGETAKDGFKLGLRPENMLAFGIGGAPLVGGALGLANEMWGSNKDEDQMKRDRVRKKLQGLGIADSNYAINGVDIGGDGSKQTYNVQGDLKDPSVGNKIGMINSLASILTGQGHLGKQATDTAGFLTNALLKSEDPRATAKTFYEKAGYKDSASVGKAIDDLKAKGVIDDGVASAFKNGVTEVFGQPQSSHTQQIKKVEKKKRPKIDPMFGQISF